MHMTHLFVAKPSPRRRARRAQAGFSLLEILTVLALLAILGGFMVVAFGGILGGSGENAAELFVNNTLEAPLLKYKMDMGGFPTTDQGLAALVTAPGNTTGTGKWRGPYLRRIPVDPWNNPYQYRFPGTHNPGSYDVWSLGPDGVPSGDDIGNWQQRQ
jgi:general secretion pathway protein G